MKKVFLSIVITIIAGLAFSVSAQDLADLRARTIKENNIAKVAKKEAKEKKKDGWEPYGASAMLEDQIFERTVLQKMRDKGRSIYLMGFGDFTTDDPGMAIKFARERAIQEIAQHLGTSVAEAIKTNAAIDPATNKTVNDAKTNAMSIIERNLGETEPVVMMIRDAKNKPGYYQATVVLAYDRKLAAEQAAQAALAAVETEDPELKKAVQDAMTRLTGEDEK